MNPKNKLTAFMLGMWEFRLHCTWADPARDDEDGLTALDDAYDLGREWAHRLTFRAWDD